MIMTYMSIESVRKHVSVCTKCNLCTDRTNAVPGAGDTESRIILVGEAPGRSEDIRGEPFVGSAGSILSSVLEHAGIRRDSIYITNVVKCRPPGNRVPTDAERQSCSEYLDAELDLIKPDIVCVMGNTAFKSILGGDNITKHRGRVFKKDGLDYFVTIHPAAAIYNRDLLPVLQEDMQRLARMVLKSDST